MKRILLLFGALICLASNAQIIAPMTESFNTTSVPTGWTLTNTTGSNWQFGGVNNNVNCPPAFDHSNNAGNYTWHDHSGTDASVILEMDTVDVSALTTPYLEFFYWMCGTGYTPTNSVIVEAYNGIGSWLLVDSIGTSTNGWEYKGYNISGFTYGSNRVLIRFRSESGGSGSDFFGDPAMDDISIVTEPLCPRPSGLTVSNITTTAADLSWNISATATSGYKIISGPAGFNPVNSGTLNTSAASPLTLSSLTGNTVYDVYLIADCGAVNGESDTLGPVSFRTACVAEPVGYFNGFENDATNAAPLCWANYLTSGNANTNVITFTLPNTGAQHVQMASSTSIVGTDTLMLMSPELVNLSSGNNQVRFFSKADNVAVELIVGTVSNPGNPGSFSAIDTIRFNSALTYEEYIIPISLANGYNGTDLFVAFKMDRSATFQEVYLDDFNYEAIPPCGKITGGFVTGVTGTTVTLSFNSSGTTTGYEWGPVGFSQGTGTTDSIPGNPITIGGLSASTSYDIYIRNDCRAAGNGTSIWSGPFTFTTLCAVLPAPYFQNFESSTVGHWDGIENCWGYQANNPGTSSSGGYSWEVRNTAQVTSGTGTGPDRDNTLAPNVGGNFITADVSGSSTAGPDSVMLNSPLVDISSLLVPELSFYYHKWGSNMPDLAVDIWDGVWHRNAMVIPGVTQISPADPYLKGTIDLSTYNDTVMVSFRVLTLGCCQGDVGLDDIRFDEQPTCDAPSLLSLLGRTSNGGTVNWVPGGSAVATNVEYGITGFTPGSGTTVISPDTVETITGLNPNTTYDVYIYDSCGAGNGNSFLVGPITFTTKCLISPTNLPWNEGFESYTAGPYVTETDFCNPTYIWEFAPTINGRLRVAAGAAYPKTGTNAFTLDKSSFSSPATANFLTLNVDLSNYTSAAGIELGFSVLEHLQEPNADNKVWVRGSSIDPWIQIVDLDQFTISGTYVDIANVDIVNPLANAGQTVGAETQIRFGQAGTTTSSSATCCDGFTFDDVSLVEVTCPTPTGLSANGITDGAANLVWNPTTPSVNYEVWFGPQGFSQGSGTTGGVRVFTGGADSLYVDTLSSNTCYEFLLRYVCAPGDTSLWVGPYVVCTECATYPAPYFESFEGIGTAVGHWDGKNGDCWDFSSNNPGTNSSGGYSWEVRNTAQATSGTGTGPDRDNTLAPAIGGRFITADVSGSATGGPDSTILTSPVIDISSLTSPEFQFYYHMHGIGMADLHVDIWNGSSWDRDEIVITGTQNTSQSDPYNDTIYDLTAYLGQIDLKVRFRARTNGCCTGDIAIDDIRISDPVTCAKPTNLAISNITATGVRFDWDAGSSVTSGNYEVSYGVNLGSPAGGTSSIQAGDSLILTNLTNATVYCYYVREVCAPGDSSAWAGPLCFQTLCLNQSLPYGENFNLNEGCMTLVAGTTPVGWEPQPAGGANQFGDLDGTGYMIADSDAHGNGIHMIVDMETPIIDASTISAGNLLMLEFDQFFNAITNGGGDSGVVEVFDGTAWNIVYSTNSDVGAFSAPDQQSIDITSYANANLQVRFHFDDDNTWAWYWAVDNLLISEQNPGCTAPSALTSSQVDCNQIELTWTSNSGGSIIEYGTAGFTPGTGTYTNITTSPVFVTALAPLTSYDFYVADTCGNDTSSWFGPFNETTIACPAGCLNPTGLDTASTSCTTADLVWVSGATTIASAVEWGPTGYLPGTGTAVGNASNPLSLSGLSPGTSYDFYVIDFCATDTSGVVGPFTFTTRTGPLSAAFTSSLQGATLTNRIVDVVATSSQGASTYTWDWGDASPRSTVSSATNFHSYTANGTYDIKLIISGDCGMDSTTVTVVVAGISIAENALGRSLALYPNPTAGLINLSFTTQETNASISILDLSGKLLRVINASDIRGEYKDQLDISKFAKGSYILRIESGDLSVQRRIVKK